MVFDKDTGKPKGYGFCEFFDVHTAESAVRNLNGHDLNGRSLRVDFADETQGNPGGGSGPPPVGPQASRQAAAAMGGLGPGGPAQAAQDPLTNTLAGMTRA